MAEILDDKDYWDRMCRAVELKVHIPEDGYVGRKQDTLTVVIPTCWEGATPEAVSHYLKVALEEAHRAALHELREMGYITDGG